MKTPPFLLIGCPVIIFIAAVVYALTYPELRQTAIRAALVDAERPASTADDYADWNSPETPRQRMRRAFALLGLTDAQQQQIEQIRQTVSDRIQRRAAIIKVLSPEQRSEWEQMRSTQRKETPSSSSATEPEGP